MNIRKVNPLIAQLELLKYINKDPGAENLTVGN
jgi:hypothetical protein